MKATYVKTKWIDNKTPVNAANLNKIEDSLGYLYNNALGITDIVEGKGIKVNVDSDKKEVQIGVGSEVMNSSNISGIEYVFDSGKCTCACHGEDYKKGVLYLVLNKDTKKLVYIAFNGVKIFEVV